MTSATKVIDVSQDTIDKMVADIRKENHSA